MAAGSGHPRPHAPQVRDPRWRITASGRPHRFHQLDHRQLDARGERDPSGPVLGTLSDLAENPRIDISGVYDRTQMDEVERQWSGNPAAAWKLKAWEAVQAAIPFGSKVSTPYQSGSVHDFMHAKATVCDDT